MIPENVASAFMFAQGCWPHDPSATSEATAIAWSPALSRYSTDELCRAFEELAHTSKFLPALSVVIEELSAQRRKAAVLARPLLTPPAPSSAELSHRQIWKTHDEIVQKRIDERVAYERKTGQPVSAERLATIRSEEDFVGPFEAEFMRRRGVKVEAVAPVGGGLDASTLADAVTPSGGGL